MCYNSFRSDGGLHGGEELCSALLILATSIRISKMLLCSLPVIAGVMLASSLEYTGTENALISTNSGEEAIHRYFIFPNPLSLSLFQITLSCSVHNYTFWLPE